MPAAILVAVAVIVLSGFAAHAPAQNQSSLTLNRIRTDNAAVFYANRRPACAWFVEAVYADHRQSCAWFVSGLVNRRQQRRHRELEISCSDALKPLISIREEGASPEAGTGRIAYRRRSYDSCAFDSITLL